MAYITQFEVAGQELGLFIGMVDLTDRYAWRMYCRRQKESDEAFDIIKRAIAKADDPDRIPVKKNWEKTRGSVTVDDTDELAYIVDFAEAGRSSIFK